MGLFFLLKFVWSSYCFIVAGPEGFSSEMEEELKNYFKRHSSDKIEDDDGVRVSDTKLYAETHWISPEKKLLGYLAKQVRNSVVYANFIGSANIPCPPKTEENTEEPPEITQADVHRAWDPEMILPFSKEVCKTATIVSSPTPAYVKPSHQTPLCDVIDRSCCDDVIITHEVQHFSRNKNQNRNASSYALTHRTSQKSLQASDQYLPQNSQKTLQTNVKFLSQNPRNLKCGETKVTFMSKMRIRYKELPLISTFSRTVMQNRRVESSLTHSNSQYPLINRVKRSDTG